MTSHSRQHHSDSFFHNWSFMHLGKSSPKKARLLLAQLAHGFCLNSPSNFYLLQATWASIYFCSPAFQNCCGPKPPRALLTPANMNPQLLHPPRFKLKAVMMMMIIYTAWISMLQIHAHWAWPPWATTIIKLIIFVTYGECWVCLGCHNPPNFDMDNRIFILHTDVIINACTQGCKDIKRESALKVDFGK